MNKTKVGQIKYTTDQTTFTWSGFAIGCLLPPVIFWIAGFDTKTGWGGLIVMLFSVLSGAICFVLVHSIYKATHKVSEELSKPESLFRNRAR